VSHDVILRNEVHHRKKEQKDINAKNTNRKKREGGKENEREKKIKRIEKVTSSFKVLFISSIVHVISQII
jgi:3-dehydroquinate dehydratase